MSRADAMKRTTLIFIALGPVIGGIFIFAQFVVFDHPPALAELFTF